MEDALSAGCRTRYRFAADGFAWCVCAFGFIVFGGMGPCAGGFRFERSAVLVLVLEGVEVMAVGVGGVGGGVDYVRVGLEGVVALLSWLLVVVVVVVIHATAAAAPHACIFLLPIRLVSFCCALPLSPPPPGFALPLWALARGHLQKQHRMARAAKVSAKPGLGGLKLSQDRRL